MSKGVVPVKTLALLMLLFCTNLFAQKISRPNGRRMTASDQIRFQKAIEAYEAGRYIEAQPVLQELARTYPSNADVQAATGMLFLESGKIESGLPFLSKAYRLNSQSAEIAANLGLAY